MIENFITMLTIVFPFALFIGGIAFFCYIENEQEHRHKLELEKAKQGIFDQPTDKEPFYKKYCKHIILILIITIIVILICYFFNVPSELAKYILELIN